MIDHMIQNKDQYDILIVDDTHDSLELLNRILKQQGYRVRLATNGRLALKSVAAKLPDLILLDVKMPEIDGYEVCRRLKSDEHSRDVPVIFISAYGETANKVEGFKAGGVDYITKPFEREEVLARVEIQLRLHELTERLEQQVDQRTRQLRQEITERKQVERLLNLRVTLMEYASTHSLEELLVYALDEVEKVTESPISFYHFVNPDQKTLSLQAWSTRTVSHFCTAKGKGLHYTLDKAGVWVDCVHQRRPVIHNDYESLPHKKGMPAGHAPVTREMVVPIFRGGKIVAILGVGNKPIDYKEDDVKVAKYCADVAWEITDRKLAEEKLRESEERFRSIFDNAVEGIFQATPGATGRFISANQAHARILGYDSPERMMAEVTEIGPHIWIDPQDRKAFSVQVAKGTVTDFEVQLRRRDGRLIWVSLNARPIFNASGKLDCIEGIMLDITDRKQAEKKLGEYREHLEELVRGRTAQLEAANKEMQAFTYTVSHDLRAPLRHIDGFIELLQKKTGTFIDEQGRHYMAAISDAARKMGVLIDDLLSFSRMGRHTQSFQKVALDELVRDILREFKPDTSGRKINWHIGDLPVVSADGAMLRVVLVNLISNALKFTRPRLQAQIEIGSLPDQSSETVIFVRDNGVGFDMAYADKLFGVFQRLHRADEFEGTGIGLANVRRIIARHGGRTWAEGEPDKGAAIYFTLPRTR